MDDSEAWLRELGYDVELSVEDGFTWAALRSQSNRQFLISRYGRGSTRDEAIDSAAARYRVEEIGSDNRRKPDEPLP